MNKKRVLFALLALTVALCVTACGSGSKEETGSASGAAPADPSISTAAESRPDSEEPKDTSIDAAAEDQPDSEEPEEPSIEITAEGYEFTKTVFEEDLDKPITVYGLTFDEKDMLDKFSLDQRRDNFHLHIGVLAKGVTMEDHMATCQAENLSYATTIATGYNIQQADASNADGTAKFTALRYTNFEDDGENDYKYLADLDFTDGATVTNSRFLYDIDKEYFNGEEVEAMMRAITGKYGIDYDRLNWVDQDSQH